MKKVKNNSYIGTHDYSTTHYKNNYLGQEIKRKGGHNE